MRIMISLLHSLFFISFPPFHLFRAICTGVDTSPSSSENIGERMRTRVKGIVCSWFIGSGKSWNVSWNSRREIPSAISPGTKKLNEQDNELPGRQSLEPEVRRGDFQSAASCPRAADFLQEESQLASSNHMQSQASWQWKMSRLEGYWTTR
jgi:hypothetical protein